MIISDLFIGRTTSSNSRKQRRQSTCSPAEKRKTAHRSIKTSSKLSIPRKWRNNIRKRSSFRYVTYDWMHSTVLFFAVPSTFRFYCASCKRLFSSLRCLSRAPIFIFTIIGTHLPPYTHTHTCATPSTGTYTHTNTRTQTRLLPLSHPLLPLHTSTYTHRQFDPFEGGDSVHDPLQIGWGPSAAPGTLQQGHRDRGQRRAG